MNIAFTFSMNKFVENPAALTFVLTLPAWINWFIPPIVNFLSDRIWTRIGRRKPFVIISWTGTILFISLMPLAPSFGWLLAFYMGFSIFNQLGGPVEALKLEVVPPAQRAMSAAVMQWMVQIAVIVFFWVALGRFDEVTPFFGKMTTGEQGLFWTVSLGMVVMMLLLTLGIKETNPHSALRGEKFTPGNIFRGLFSSHLWPVYILACSSAFLGTGLGALNNLLITIQWGYTMQDLGNNIVIGGLLNLAIFIPLCGLFSNKVGRFRIYVILVVLGVFVNVGMYTYYSFVLYDSKPTIIEMVMFGEMLSVLGILIGMTYVPLVYDFIPRNEMGTYAAGSGLITQATQLVTGNLVGFFVWLYASLFLGPAGEMSHVVLREDVNQAKVLQIMQAAQWTDPANGARLTAPHVSAKAWYATYAHLNHGRGFEVRLANKSSAKLRDERDAAESEQKKREAREKYQRQRAKAAVAAGKPADDALRQAEAEKAEAEKQRAIVKARDEELQRRALEFQKQAQTVLADSLLRDGEQVLAFADLPALIATYPTSGRCTDSGAVEKTLDRLRTVLPDLIDLRIIHASNDSYALEVSLVTGGDAAATLQRYVRALPEKIEPALAAVIPGLSATTTPTTRTATATRLDLRIVEDPLDRHPSPVTRLVATLWPEYHNEGQRLRAVGRGLRREGWVSHAGATTVPGDDRAIRVTAVIDTVPESHRFVANPATPEAVKPATRALADKPKDEEKPGAGVLARLASLGDAGRDRAAALYSLAVRAGAEKRMTVARPVILSAYAKQEWDYLTGYLAILVLQCVGIGIIFIFVRMVKKGQVRQRGVEEAEAVR
jgi:Na+/melibiose symporter-like transporter